MNTITADSTPRPKRPITTGDAALDARIRELVTAAGGEKPRELIEEMLTTALKMADAGCPLVQRQAIDHARRAQLPLIVRSFDSLGTRVA